MTWKSVQSEMPEFSAYFLAALKLSSETIVDIIFFSKNKGWQTNEKITHWTDIPYKYMDAIDRCRHCNGAPIRKDFSADGKFGSYCEECNNVVTVFDKLTDLSQITPPGQ